MFKRSFTCDTLNHTNDSRLVRTQVCFWEKQLRLVYKEEREVSGIKVTKAPYRACVHVLITHYVYVHTCVESVTAPAASDHNGRPHLPQCCGSLVPCFKVNLRFGNGDMNRCPAVISGRSMP